MGPGQEASVEYAPEDLAGAHIIGGVVLGGAISLVLWAAIIGILVF